MAVRVALITDASACIPPSDLRRLDLRVVPITVQVGGQTQTFADGGGITFPKNAGGKRQFTIDHVEFAGYGLNAPAAQQEDYRGREVNGAAVVWLGANGPKGFDPSINRRQLAGRNRYATEQLHAAASVGPAISAITTNTPAMISPANTVPNCTASQA